MCAQETRRALGQHKECLEAYRRLIAINPDDWASLCGYLAVHLGTHSAPAASDAPAALEANGYADANGYRHLQSYTARPTNITALPPRVRELGLALACPPYT